MKRLGCVLIVLFVVSLVADTVEARGRRRGRSYSYASVSVRTYGGGVQAVASSKASTCAARGVMCHLGGGFGGANAEGVGFSSYSAQAALNNCCFTGQRRVAASSVVRGARGWYAVKLFW